MFTGRVIVPAGTHTAAQVEVERSYNGAARGDRTDIWSDAGDCTYQIGPAGSRHFFGVTHANGRASVHMCTSFAIDPASDRNARPFLAALDRINPPLTPSPQPAGRPYGDDIMRA